MTLADLAWCVEDVRRRLAGYALFRAYDEGNHRLTFATDKYRNTFGDLFREFADNMCDDVVDGIVDRLQIIGWTAPDTRLNRTLDDMWDHNRGPARTGAIMRNAFREGDGFSIVQADTAGRARIWKQRPETMAVRYSTSDPDLIEVAGKVWKAGKRYRANLYYPDGTTEKYATKGLGLEGSLPQARAFVPLAAGDPDLDPDATSHVVLADTEGMPVFHFPNGEVSEYGRSAIEKVIPLQDALNKSVADMLVAMEFHAYPQRWATGVQVERNADGTERSPFQAGEGRVWRTGSKEAKFGQFDAGDMTGFLEVQDGFRLEIARKGALPPHTINLRTGGTPPTGVAMLVAEGKTVKMAKDRQRDWGHTYREMMAYGARLEGLSGVTAADLDLAWAPPETRDMKALLEELLLKRDLGVPDRQLLLEAGYDTDQVDQFAEDLEAEGEAAQLAAATLGGGRQSVTRGQAGALGVPSAPAPPAGGQTALAS